MSGGLEKHTFIPNSLPCRALQAITVSLQGLVQSGLVQSDSRFSSVRAQQAITVSLQGLVQSDFEIAIAIKYIRLLLTSVF